MRIWIVGPIALIGFVSALELRSSAPPSKTATTLPYFDSRDFTPRWSSVAHRIGEFSLVDQNNRPITNRDLAGKIHVASFFFASCSSLCPTLLEGLKPVQRAIHGRSDVTMVSYSVTPQADLPQVLADFGRHRGIDSSTWRLASGDLQQIKRLIRESYFADDERVTAEGKESRILHSEKVLLVDRRGRIRGVYNGTNRYEIEKLIEDIEALRRTAD